MLVHVGLLKGVLVNLLLLVVNFVEGRALREAFYPQGSVGSVEVAFKFSGLLGDIDHVHHDAVPIPVRGRFVG